MPHRYGSRLALIVIVGVLLASVAAVPAFAAGTQGGNRVCTGDNIEISSGETARSVLAFGCNVTIDAGATVQGDVSAFGGNVNNQGTVTGSIIAFGGNINIGASGVVGGNVTPVGGTVAAAPGATVHGATSTAQGLVPPVPPIPPTSPVFGFGRTFNLGFSLLGALVTALAFAALGALIVIFAPEPTRRVSQAVQSKPFNSIGVGCLSLIILPILALLLIITIVGIPVVFVLGIVATIAWIFGSIAVGYLAGEKILQAFRARNILPVLAVIVGVIVLMLVGQIPVFGWLVSCLVGLIGIGAVVLTRFGTRAYPPLPPLVMTSAAAMAAAAPAYAPSPTTSSSNVPGTYTPSAVDAAAWEARAREAQARDQANAASSTIIDVPPAQPTEPPTTPAGTPPADVPPADASDKPAP